MRSLYDPGTLFMIASAMSVVGGAMGAADAKANAKAEAAYLDAEAEQARKQTARDKADLLKEEGRLQSRARAILAAGGGGTTEGSGLALLTSNAAEYGIKQSRLDDDVNNTVSSLQARSANVTAAGDRAANAAIFGGISKAVGLYGQSRTLSAAPRATRPPGR